MSYKSVKDLDAIDIKIIEKLCQDSSASLADIAEELGVSASTVHKRINTLKDNNIIERFTIVFDPMILNLKTVAFVGIELERNALVGKRKDEVIRELMDTPEVLEIYETLEPFDIMLKLRTNNVDILREIIGNISGVQGVLSTNTILTTKKIMETPLKYENIMPERKDQDDGRQE